MTYLENKPTDVNQFGQMLGELIHDWVPCQRPTKALMLGKYAALEAINIDKHAEELFSAFQVDNQGESWTYLPYGPFGALNEFKDSLQNTMSDPDTLLYAIMDLKSEKFLGISGYLRMNTAHGTIELGHIHFSKLLQKTPLATEAIYLLLSQVFDEYKYRRCEWKCHIFNEPSRRAATRFGFSFEGIFRQHSVIKGRNRDTAWFSMLDAEWPEIKYKFQQWLDLGNFDASGMQKTKLLHMINRHHSYNLIT